MTQRRYALLGSPVAGSKSPLIHETSFSFNQLDATYEAFEVLPEQLGETLKAFIREGYSGFNITIPHKEAVLAFIDELDPVAQQMGAVNTLSVENGKIKGYNTDGAGLLTSLTQHGVSIKDLKVLVLGAGGAAKGICHALAIAGAMQIDICNRSQEKAKSLAMVLGKTYNIMSHVVTFEDTTQIEAGSCYSHGKYIDGYDLVINATSVGMLPNIEVVPIAPELFSPDTIFCDIVYKPHETLFLKRATAMGSKCIHGIEMLMFQALLSEQIWEKRPLDLEGTREALYQTEGLIFQSPK